MAKTFDICIRGAGIVGKTLALLLARERLKVALIPAAQTPATSDVRAYALNQTSRQLLESLRSWPDEEHATAVKHMRVQGDLDGLVHFDATTQGVDALAWIIDVPALEARLSEAVRYQPQVEVLTVPVDATLTVVCEGRSSSTRAEYGADFHITPYAQTAIATRVVTDMPHEQIARQWFSAQGILAFLPLGGPQGNASAVVWSVPQHQAPALMELSASEFAHSLQQASHATLGGVQLISERAAWPLQLAKAERWCGKTPHSNNAPDSSWVLAGDAAHNVHPLAGQGLNLGLADVKCLAQALLTREPWRSVSDLRLLRQYERERKAALLAMELATDSLQQIFSRSEPPLQALRNWGMKGFERSAIVKDFVARQAMGTI